MATNYHEFGPFSAVMPGTVYPQILATIGTNFPVPGLAFDETLDEACFFFFRAINYASAPAIDIEWYADNASTNAVVWSCQLAAITPETDTQDVQTKAFAAAQTVTDTHLGTTGQRVHRCSISIVNTDSLAAGDWCCLKFQRIGSSGSDTMNNDAILTKIVLSYTTT